MQTIHNVIEACSHQVSPSYLNKAIELQQQLSAGSTYQQLGGKQIRQDPVVIRFKIGRKWRLLYLLNQKKLVPWCLISRQDFEKTLRRRCK